MGCGVLDPMPASEARVYVFLSAKMADYHRPDAKTLQNLKDIANRLRIGSIRATTASNSGYAQLLT